MNFHFLYSKLLKLNFHFTMKPTIKTKNSTNYKIRFFVLNSLKFKENVCIDKDYENFKDSDVEDFKICIENSGVGPIMILSNVALALSIFLKFI